MGVDAAFVNQDLKSPAHPIVAIDKRFCHDRPISVVIPQDILQHPNHGAIYEVAKDEFGQHGVGKNNKNNKNSHDPNHPNHGAVHNMAQKVTGHDKHDKYGQNEIRNNELPLGGALHPTQGATRGTGQNEYGQNNEGYDKNQHTGVRNVMHDAAHGTGQNEYGGTGEGYDKTQHTGVRNAMHDAAHGTGQNEYGRNEYGQNEYGRNDPSQGGVLNPTRGVNDGIGQNEYGQNDDGYDRTQHTGVRNMMHDVAHGTGQNEYGRNEYGQSEYGRNETQHGGASNPTYGLTHLTGQNTTGHNDPSQGGIHNATHGIGQNKYDHNETGKHENHGLGNNLGKNGKGPLLFNLASMALNDRDDRVLKDAHGKPIVYLTEKNRVIMRNFVVTRDADGQDKIFDVKRKHLSKSPVRADFKDLASGRMCRLGAAVLEETHGITALLWLDIGDGTKEKIPVGRLHLPPGSHMDPNVTRATDNYHKITDAMRPVAKQHKDVDGRHSKDYQLDLMPGVDAGLAVLVAMVTAACADHKRRSDDNDKAVKHSNTV